MSRRIEFEIEKKEGIRGWFDYKAGFVREAVSLINFAPSSEREKREGSVAARTVAREKDDEDVQGSFDSPCR